LVFKTSRWTGTVATIEDGSRFYLVPTGNQRVRSATRPRATTSRSARALQQGSSHIYWQPIHRHRSTTSWLAPACSAGCGRMSHGGGLACVSCIRAGQLLSTSSFTASTSSFHAQTLSISIKCSLVLRACSVVLLYPWSPITSYDPRTCIDRPTAAHVLLIELVYSSSKSVCSYS
jgi:hypothetical protein